MFSGIRYSRPKEYEPIFPSLTNEHLKSKHESSQSIDYSQIDSASSGGFYTIADKDASELNKIAESKAENAEIEIICNGIRFKGTPIEVEALPDLICEECEKSLSTVKCEACDQVFCLNCYHLCHERLEQGEVLHPHEVDKMVRPICAGDTSNIVVDTSFIMPNHEFYENDMLEQRELSVPKTLALSSESELPLTAPRKALKYQRGDIVLYDHPALKSEVYGKIESEWDFRNGDSAPSLVRSAGDGLVCYIVRCQGMVTPSILKQLEEEPILSSMDQQCQEKGASGPLKNLPILEGVESMSLTSERVLANRIDKRLGKAKYYRDYGPKHHLNPPIPRGFGNGAGDDDESLAGAVDDDDDDDCDDDSSGHDAGAGTTGTAALSASDSSLMIRSTRPPTTDELRASSLPHPIASRRTVDGVVSAYSVIAEVEATLSHRVYDPSLDSPLLQRRNMITIQSEDTLVKPREKLKTLQLQQKENIKRCLTKRFASMFSNWLLWAFQLWLMKTSENKKIISFGCAVRIQTLARRWLAKQRLKELINLSEVEARERWLAVHQKFNYCSNDYPGAVTMDNKIYFENIRDVNLYGKELRIATSRFFNIAAKKRISLLRSSFQKWNTVISTYREIDMGVTHLSGHEAEKDKIIEGKDRTKLVSRTRRMHKDLHDSGRLFESEEGQMRVDADPSDDSRLNLNSLPMALHRQCNDSGAEPPPWHPSVGFLKRILPSLPPLPRYVTDRNSIRSADISEKQKYNSFRSAIEGPTDFSCWIIPGRLAMGKIPCGKARRKGPVDSVIHTHTDATSQILLSGLSTFVSVVTNGEETDEIRNDITLPLDAGDNIDNRIRYCHKSVRDSLKEHLFSLSQMIEEKNIQLEDYSHIEDNSHLAPNSEKRRKIDKLKKERNRLRAKKLILSRESDSIRGALNAYPSGTDWLSFPLEHNSAPALDRIIPILWKIEQKLWEGSNIYIYSKEGNGRSGLICACLLGRLYGLTHSETLLRMQIYYDCQRSQLEKNVSSNCPQMRRQQELVSRMLMITNRIYQGISHRSATDPDSFSVEIEHMRRGVQIESNDKVRSDPAEGKTQRKVSLVRRAPTQSTLPPVSIPKRKDELEMIEDDLYVSTSLNMRTLSMVRPVPKSRPAVCDSPAKHRSSIK